MIIQLFFVTWKQAFLYCEWANRRLPTEAEWEKAARGTDSRILPWDGGLDCNKGNYLGCELFDTSEVGNFESGKSPYGVYDMAGNVEELVYDFYQANYYSVSPSENPQGPYQDENLSREQFFSAHMNLNVTRGGSWYSHETDIRTTARLGSEPLGDRETGFRCAQSE